VRHDPPAGFRRGDALPIELEAQERLASVRLLYRHVNQAEPWRTATMTWEEGRYRATVPAEYTDSPFPLQHYFVLAAGSPPRPALHPGFNATWSNPPYFVVRQLG